MEDSNRTKVKLRFRLRNKDKRHEAGSEPTLDPAPHPDPAPGPDSASGLQSLGLALVRRERQMMMSGLCEQDQDQLHSDLEKLWVQIQIQVHGIFRPGFRPDLLREAVHCILDQEDLDRSWLDCPAELVPVWRPNRTLHRHNRLLERMVQSRLRPETPTQTGPETRTETGPETGLSSCVKQELLRLARLLLSDLLFVSRTLIGSYPGHMDILNHFLKLYHNSFRLRLHELADASLEGDRAYLLLWTNHSYRQEVLLHPELRHRLDSDLGPLLSPVVLTSLRDQHQVQVQQRVSRCLGNILLQEQRSWRSERSEVIDGFCFSPLALEVIQVIDEAIQEITTLSTDQSPDQNQIWSQIPGFINSYRLCLQEHLEGNLQKKHTSLKTVLVCEEQLREFVNSRVTDSELRQKCLDSLSGLKDCGYCSLTSGVQLQIKSLMSGLWSQTLDLDSVLDFLSLELDQLQDLKASCRQVVVTRLHQDMALRYVKTLLKTRGRSLEGGGARSMKDHAHKLHQFFTAQGGACAWTQRILDQVSEILRLQDPDLVQLELVSLIQTCPDFSAAHVSQILFLKSDLSAASVRKIKRSVEENRPSSSTNQSAAFFSRIKVQILQNKVKLKFR